MSQRNRIRVEVETNEDASTDWFDFAFYVGNLTIDRDPHEKSN